MTRVAEQIHIASGGEFSVAPAGSTLPDDLTTALDAAFQGLGWSTDDGGSITATLDKTGVPAWGSGGAPVFNIITGSAVTVKTALLQSNAFNMALFMGSGDYAETETDSGEFAAEVPIAAVIKEFALVIDWTEGSYTHRFVISKCDASADGDLVLQDKDVKKYGVTFESLVPDSGYKAKHFTDDPAYDVTA